jgi:DNA-binding CsgD family transcriptional regulator
MPATGTPGLIGRAGEREVLDGLLANVHGGQSAVLVVRGEAGIGKTALLRYAAGQACGFRVAHVTGVEAEMELPFAATHQLCAPMLDHLDPLPRPQRDALRVALGLASGEVADRFLVGLAVLSLLSAVAEERPLLCLVDDAQWLDAASAQVLGFVARRVLAESLALVFAVRAPDAARDFDGLPGLPLEGLPENDARALLATVVTGRLDDRVRDRIVAETRGNPLALLDLPRRMTAAELAGGFELPPVGDLTGHIEQRYLRHIGELPEATQRLLLLAAADPVGDAALVWRAAASLRIDETALGPAQDADLLEIGARVRFRHPLVRSAVYRSAALEQRRLAHLALAGATDGEADRDRRAWHRAAAADGPDERLAEELEHSAARAQARGGLAAAAALLRHAVALTGHPERRADRALAAAGANLQAGAFDVARELLITAEVGAVDEVQRARVDLLRAEVAYSESRGSDAPALLLRAAKRLGPLDPRLARQTYLDAWSSALFAGSLATAGSLHHVSREALAAPPPTGAREPFDLLLEGFALALAEGRADAAPVLAQAATAFGGEDASAEEVLRWGWLATAAAAMVWDYDTCRAVAARGVELAREAGALGVLAVSANVLTQAVVLGGEFETAALLVGEAASVTEATGTQVACYGALVLGGHQGREAAASALIDTTIEAYTAAGQGTAVQYAHWARALLLNGLGRYPEAMAAAIEASEDTPELFVAVWAAVELLEAATRSGEPEAAQGALDRIVAATSVARTDWALGIQARSRALRTEGARADRLYREAIMRLARTRLRPELARSHLLYGEWLRRENRRVDARQNLRTAHAMLNEIGMEAFAERARRELVATGERARRRSADTRDELTAQEEQIARLAREGLSNPEIGARLFISPRTVEWHLHKVFGKLGISSRSGLHDALPSQGGRAALV